MSLKWLIYAIAAGAAIVLIGAVYQMIKHGTI